MEKEQEKKGCPCGAFGKCCDKPEISGTDHECDAQCEEVCEESYGLECGNCGSICYHEF